jgi:magnesium transporter
MQKVLPFRRMAEMTPYMDAKLLGYINEGQIETFESFENFNIITFDWYEAAGGTRESPRLMIYQDREDLLFFCEDERAADRVQGIVSEATRDGPLDNQQLQYRFFARLLKGDLAYLDGLETDITNTENEMIAGSRKKKYLGRIVAYRKELLRLKHYYEQLDSVFDELTANDNGILTRGNVRRFTILGARTDRYLKSVQNLQEYVAQMREAYQSQLSIQQNDLMRVFTIVTVIFLPLTLIVGWYGMNFIDMPELRWKYGYPAVIAVSAAVVAFLIWLFKRKKWL